MPLDLLDILCILLVLSGLAMFAGAAVGLLRFPDFYTRMHAAGKGDTLSTLLIMAGVGVYLMQQPVAGLAKLTILLMAYLIATGILEIIVALQLRPADGWMTEAFSGAASLILGILLWRQFPLSGAWAVGVLFGIKMMFNGWALVFVSRAARAFANKVEAEQGG